MHFYIFKYIQEVEGENTAFYKITKIQVFLKKLIVHMQALKFTDNSSFP